MSSVSNLIRDTRGSWFGVAGFSIVHLLTFGALYLTVVQLFWVAQDHYAAIGTAVTPEFSRLASISNFVASWTPIVVFLIVAEVAFVARSARKGKRWVCAYSHAMIFAIGFAMFASSAWIIHPMAWSVPAASRAVADKPTRPAIDQLASGGRSHGSLTPARPSRISDQVH